MSANAPEEHKDLNSPQPCDSRIAPKRQRSASIFRDERLSRRPASSATEILHPFAPQLVAPVLYNYDGNQQGTASVTGTTGEQVLHPVDIQQQEHPGVFQAAESEHIAIPRHHIRSISFPASSTPVVTESSYLAGLPCPSPAASYLSKFAADSGDPSLCGSSFVLCENSVMGNYVLGKVIGRGSVSECRDASQLLSPELYKSLHSDTKHKPDISTDTYEQQMLKTQSMYDNLVLKIVRGPQASSQRVSFDREIEIWKSLDHPHILPLLDVIEMEDIKATVSPRAALGDMLVYIKEHGALSAELCRNIFKQLCLAVQYLHNVKHIYHRDIKLENVLLHTNQHVYLCDFGLSEYYIPSEHDGIAGTALSNGTKATKERRIDACTCEHCKTLEGGSWSKGRHSMPTSPTLGSSAPQITSQHQHGDHNPCPAQNIDCGAGSLWYCPPEELVPEIRSSFPCMCSRKMHATKGDIWSLGVVLYAMLTGSLPFLDEYLPRLQMSIRNGDYHELPEEIPAAARNLVRAMLTVDVESRLSIDGVLGSEWFKNEDLCNRL